MGSGQDTAREGTADEGRRPRSIGLFLVPNFSMLAFSSLVEPLRAANRVEDRRLYDWSVYSVDGGPVTASNGVDVAAQFSHADVTRMDMAVVCAGLGVEKVDHRPLMAVLRRLAAFGSSIGAVCTGTYVLAKSGLLDGHAATIHWENHQSLLAEFGGIDVVQELFRIDGKRYTCAGGTAGIDMMLAVIREDHGEELVAKVTDQLIHHRTRDASERQRMELRARLGVAHPKLCKIVQLMETTTENPLSCAELAFAGGLSVRQLERLFAKYLGHSPRRHYLMIRLERARWLLRQTTLPVLHVAVACGFTSPSHFSKSYQDMFGCTPTSERQAKGAREPKPPVTV
jgi:transcriptional regulator GlxA family with amidase domain